MASSEFVKDALKVVHEAEDCFHQHWTRCGLEEVDWKFSQLLKDQRALFDKACVTGTSDAVIRHRDGMVRGYQKAMQIMEKAAGKAVCAGHGGWYGYGYAETAAYTNRETGRKIVITRQKVLEKDREKGVVYLTCIEAAMLLDRLKAFDGVAEIAARWPGAEVMPETKLLKETAERNG